MVAPIRRSKADSGPTKTRYLHMTRQTRRGGQNFKVLEKRDVRACTLMVCTNCNGRVPVPGHVKRDA